jgi:putative DNA primase/helicase
MYVAYCIATAQQVMRWKAPKPRPVLYLDGEMPAVTMQERSAGIVRGYSIGPEPGYLKFVTPDLQERMPNLATTEGQASVEASIESAEVVVVDNLATLCRSGRENETESWHPVQDWILSLRRRGKAVVMVHHSNKSGGQRGTSSREDVLDTVISLRRPSDYNPEQGARFEVHLEKARGIVGDGAKPFEAMLTTDEYGLLTWVCRDLEDVEMQSVMQLNEAGYTIRDIAEETGLSKSKVGRMLRKAKEQGAI